MVYYIINFVLWMLGVSTCSVIKCFAFELKKSENKRWRYIGGLILSLFPVMVIKYICNENVFVRTACILLTAIIYIVYLQIFFEGYLWQIMLFSIFELICSFTAEMISYAIMAKELSRLDSFSFDEPIVVIYLSILYIILSMLYLFVFFVFKQIVSKGSYNLKIFYGFSIFPMSQVIMMSTINGRIYEEITPSGVAAIIGIFVGIVADIVLLITLLNQQRMQELAIKINEMEKTWEVEQNHYSDIEARREELAKIRHDLSEQFIVLQELLRQENYEKAQEMLGILRDDVSKTKEYVFCGDSIVNAIMAENEKSCLKYGIRFEYDLQIMQDLKLNPVVICSLFSNLMRNAIAAAREKEDGLQPFVAIKAAVKGDYLHIKVENSYTSNGKKTKNRKGYGLSILKTIADKYSGRMEQFADGEKYSVHIVVENVEMNEMNPSLM